MSRVEELADGGLIRYCPDFLSPVEANALLDAARNNVAWEQEISRFRRPFPRLTAYYADAGVDYAYSGVVHRGDGWPSFLTDVKERVDETASTTFNSVLLNRYPDENSSMGYHADDERELGRNPIIGSVSLGAVRTFLLRHNTTRERRSYDLAHGSLLIMAGTLQHHWRHSIPRRKRALGERVNLTFRTIVRQSDAGDA